MTPGAQRLPGHSSGRGWDGWDEWDGWDLWRGQLTTDNGQLTMNNSEICVPAAAVAEGGEDGAQTMPEPGDEIEVTLKGKVSRAEGGNLYFTPESVNGQPMAGADAPAGDGMDDEASMDSAVDGMQKEQEFA